MKIVICSDHAGFLLKQKIKTWLEKENEVLDVGAERFDSSDSYVDFAKKANEKVKNENYIGIYICGSGVGMSIVANREKEIRAVIGNNRKVIELSRKHNNSNVLCLGARNMMLLRAKLYIKTFLKTKFEGGRHLERVQSIDK